MMNKELFGVFGGGDAFERHRPRSQFDRVIEGETVTVGIRDVGLNIPNRSCVHVAEDGFCLVWGEMYPGDGARSNAARWLYDRYADRGEGAFSEPNGSYLAVLERGGDAVVVGDPIRSWECFYADAPDGRVFGTDAAAVAGAIPERTVSTRAVIEFLTLGCVLNDRTVFDDLHRVPIDHALSADATRRLERLVYRPTEFDYAGELAARLERAIRRRASLPGRKGLLLSAGYDSRAILAKVPGIERSYTLGEPDADEVRVAEALAERYGVDHEALVPDRRYLNTDPETIRYTLGVKESIHVHQAGYESEIDVDTIYHGLYWDTLLRGYYLPRDDTELCGLRLPRLSLDPDPDPVEHLAGVQRYDPAAEELIANSDLDADTSEEFFERAIRPRYEECLARCDSPYNAMELFGLQNVLSIPFRTHLADTYLESFIAADSELIDWHLRTPPEHRNQRTFREAIRRLDPALLRPRPPDRPHDSYALNQIEGFLRRTVPGLEPYGSAWPDRRRLYERNRLDYALFPGNPEYHHLPVRLKLRLNDLSVWIGSAPSGRGAEFDRSLETVLGTVSA